MGQENSKSHELLNSSASESVSRRGSSDVMDSSGGNLKSSGSNSDFFYNDSDEEDDDLSDLGSAVSSPKQGFFSFQSISPGESGPPSS